MPPTGATRHATLASSSLSSSSSLSRHGLSPSLRCMRILSTKGNATRHHHHRHHHHHHHHHHVCTVVLIIVIIFIVVMSSLSPPSSPSTSASSSSSSHYPMADPVNILALALSCSFSSVFILYVLSDLVKLIPLSILFAMDWIPLLYFLIAWYTGGQLFRRLCYVELFQPLSTELQPHYGLIPDGRVWSFSYLHMLLVLLCNPVVVLHYADISAALCAFFYAVALIVYQFVCYCMFLYLLLHFSYRLWHIAKRYNRGSIVRHSRW